ncbi:MAG: response regulator [Rhodoferax sp.]|nr:response regulator [Rhodoferax sp.]
MQALQTFLVEDSPLIQRSLITTLEELTPVRVVGVADDEGTATRWLEDAAHQADLVIVDIFLRRGSGLGVLQAAQHLHHSANMVVLSNYATQDIRRKCLALGAAQVFDKSTEIDALIAYCVDLAKA